MISINKWLKINEIHNQLCLYLCSCEKMLRPDAAENHIRSYSPQNVTLHHQRHWTKCRMKGCLCLKFVAIAADVGIPKCHIQGKKRQHNHSFHDGLITLVRTILSGTMLWIKLNQFSLILNFTSIHWNWPRAIADKMFVRNITIIHIKSREVYIDFHSYKIRNLLLFAKAITQLELSEQASAGKHSPYKIFATLRLIMILKPHNFVNSGNDFE